MIVIEGDENNLRIYDHIPKNHALFAEFVITEMGAVYKYINAQSFKNKLWSHVVKTVESLEN